MVALKTFNNLPGERRKEIILVCLEEFALHEYTSASLSNIVSALGLAKGSFYRYFESKKALYFYLIDHCITTRVKHDERIIDESTPDFFNLMTQHFAAKISFDRKYPLHSAFLYAVLQERSNEEIGNIQQISKKKVLDMIRLMVNKWTATGQLRTDTDPDTMAFMVLQTQLSIFDYIALQHNIDYRANIIQHKMLYDLPESELKKTSRQFVDMLKNGIGKTTA